MKTRHRRLRDTLSLVLLTFACLTPRLPGAVSAAPVAPASDSATTVYAEVVALDQPFMFNRLGAAQPSGMIFALQRDVVSNNATVKTLQPGQVMLRPDKRARPIVLRVNVGQYLEIKFTNLLAPTPVNPPASPGSATQVQVYTSQPGTRNAGVHIAGLELVAGKDGSGNPAPGIDSDATFVGANTDSLVAPGSSRTYRYYAKAEGTFMLYSAAGDWNGQLQSGLFGSALVEPKNAEYYRSQVTNAELTLAAYAVVPNASGKGATLPARPDLSLVRKIDADGNALTASVEGAQVPLWSLSGLGVSGQTVQKTDAIALNGRLFTPDGRPLIDYNAVFPPGHSHAGDPILRMTRRLPDGRDELIASDLTAIITGPGAGDFPFSENGPDFFANPTYPNRRQAFREITVMYHEIFNAVQAFQQFYTTQLGGVMGAGTDAFAINYGAAGIGAEVLANRLGVGPMGGKQSVDLKFEEFFLSSWSCGDPAMVVDVPANAPNQTVTAPTAKQAEQQTNSPLVSAAFAPVPPASSPPLQPPAPSTLFQPLTGQKATKAFYPDDPSNVYHSYMRDHVIMRLLHTGSGITHIHHLHAHQWLRSPNSDNSDYLDSQMIAPGSTFTLEMSYNGSGNRNETVGDAIFHCHFYPHFAGGMWALWRVHDVFEAGTKLDKNGRPADGWNRSLPDAEIERGTPIPAIVPLPTLAMAPAPAPVRLIDHGTRAEVQAKTTAPDGTPSYDNPGYPFFIPGVSGHRAPHPPLDFAWAEDRAGQPKLDAKGNKIYLDGGLPRHQVLDGTIVRELHTRWDFSKDFIAYDAKHKPIAGGLIAYELPNDGTAVEKAAMATHATRTHASVLPNGDPGNFTLNGLPPVPGAPFANPSVDENGNGKVNLRRYQAAAIQMDVVLTKQGWHYPQQRMLTLWQDVAPTLTGTRPPQPLFFRANTGETIEFWHTNLVPDYYDMDDFQVRTPTDIIGQHIHLVKFDVLASDGAGNGWNYEDGTFSPDEVRGRIDAINLSGGLFNMDLKTQFKGRFQRKLTATPAPTVFGDAPAGQDWRGAQTTIQRWDTDPVQNNKGEDRTLRTVFTHDHFGPSTHQQVGLYGGLLVEPQGSKWFDSVSGGLLYDTKSRSDGGPTTWQANIVTAHPADSYREFALEFADFQLAYSPGSPSTKGTPTAPLYTGVFTGGLQVGLLPATSPVRAVFTSFGATLATNATLAGSDSAGWTLTSSTAPGVNENYALTLSSSTGPTYQVFPQNLAAGWSSPGFVINPAGPDGGNTNSGAPYPTLISTPPAPGAFSLNYRAEPIPARVWNPTTNAPATGSQGDLSLAYASITRADPTLNVQPTPGAKINPADTSATAFTFPANLSPTVEGTTAGSSDQGKVQPTDPFTPMLRAYAGDRVQVRTLVGAHQGAHFFSMDGVKWLYEPSSSNTGFRNNQPMGISEHYEMLFALPSATAATTNPWADYLYNASAGVDGITNGLWGLMRSYKQSVANLVPLPNNAPPAQVPLVAPLTPPTGATVRSFTVVATTAKQALPNGVLTYNSRGQVTQQNPLQLATAQVINNPDALIYVRAEDLTSPNAQGQLKPGVPIEPLILRAAAGEWIQVTLINAFDTTTPAFNQSPLPAAGPPYGKNLPAVTLQPSTQAGLNPQVVGYDITAANGVNIGFNPTVTVAPGVTASPVYWYAGTLTTVNGALKATPVEFGAINLNPSDPLLQHTLGLVGALVIEPEGSTWVEDATMRAAATVTKADGTTFRDFVMVCQDDVTLSSGTTAGFATDSVNYGTEPMPYRYPPGTIATIAADVSQATSNQLVGNVDPQTPIYTATAGSEVRFRMLHPASGAGSDGETLTIDGHVFQEEPYINDSRTIGHNPTSQWFGTRGGHGARDRFDVILSSAGGDHKVPGDYLYRSMVTAFGADFVDGKWGIFRVTDPAKPPVASQALVVAAPLLKTAPATVVQPAVPAPARAESPVAQRFRRHFRPASVQDKATQPPPQKPQK